MKSNRSHCNHYYKLSRVAFSLAALGFFRLSSVSAARAEANGPVDCSRNGATFKFERQFYGNVGYGSVTDSHGGNFVIGGTAGPHHGQYDVTLAPEAIANGGTGNAFVNFLQHCRWNGISVTLTDGASIGVPYIENTSFSVVRIDFKEKIGSFNHLVFSNVGIESAKLTFLEPVQRMASDLKIENLEAELPGGWDGLLAGVTVDKSLRLRADLWKDFDADALIKHADHLPLQSFDFIGYRSQVSDYGGYPHRSLPAERVPVENLLRVSQALSSPEIAIMGGASFLGGPKLNVITNPEEICASALRDRLFVYFADDYYEFNERQRLCTDDGQVSPSLANPPKG